MLANIQEEKKNMNPNILFLRSSIQNIGLLNAKKKKYVSFQRVFSHITWVPYIQLKRYYSATVVLPSQPVANYTVYVC